VESGALARGDTILLGALGLTFAALFLLALCSAGYASEAIAAWVTGISTILLVGVAWFQLTAIRATTRADFIHRLNADFFNTETRRLLRVLEEGQTKFDASGSSPKFMEGSKVAFDAFDLDDLLLGPLEAVGIFERRGVIDIQLASQFFGWYVILIWQNSAVQEYIAWQRKQPDSSDVYVCLEDLYNRCKAVKAIDLGSA
jgi:hypothetical protein